MDGQQYLAEHKARFTWSAEGYHADADGWEHQRFTVTLSVPVWWQEQPNRVNRESFTWRQGFGIDHEPRAGEVLEALVSDARAGADDFETFAAEMGYDPDSRKAYATWEACRQVGRQLVNLFGEIPGRHRDDRVAEPLEHREVSH